MSEVSNSRRPKVAVIGTGGTFAMHARHPFDWIEYSESGIVHPIGDLMERMGQLAPDIDTVPVSFRTLGSTAITPEDWLELARLIETTAASDAGIDAFVVTHGTATLEETAWFLDLTISQDICVVVTGAQRPFNTEGSDASGNLRAALAVSISEGARGLGTLVVMDSLIFSAREVTKAASFELGAFEAPGYGPLGRIGADATVHWRHRPVGACAGQAAKRAARFPVTHVDALPRVDIVLSYAGAGGAAIDALVQAGAHAIVSAGLAPGRPAAGEVSAFAAARAQGVVVVQATRAARGSVPSQTFLTRGGVLAGGTLSPQKLRILLMLAMTTDSDLDGIQQILLGT